MQDEFDRQIQTFYSAAFDEDARLASPAGRLELKRVQELVGTRLASTSRVIDIGGGTGVHARWLAAAGHEVVLIDPVPRHIEAASQLSHVKASLGDARRLDLSDNAFDVALLFGPLYHLADRADRVQALREAVRVTRPGGLVFASVITRWAGFTDEATTLADGQPVHQAMHTMLDTGAWTPDGGFPAAHFHTSDELAAEMSDAGLGALHLEAIEGPAGLPLEFAPGASDETIEAAVKLVRALGALPGPREMTPHLLGIGRVP